MSETNEYKNALPNGYQLHEYRLKKVLGAGGFGITYLAFDTQLESDVAIKEFFPNDLAVREKDENIYPKSQKDEEQFNKGLERFFREAQTLVKFKHRNIVKVSAFFEFNHTGYFVMDYENGHSLAELIQEDDEDVLDTKKSNTPGFTLPEDKLLKIIKPLLSGLQSVHAAGYLHRDIKPQNIYLRNTDHSPVLIDFGSARYDSSGRSLSTNMVVSFGYSPFEQYESTESKQGPWTDIYSMGAVLYRLISGYKPEEAPKRIGASLRGTPDPMTPAVEVGKGKYSKSLLEGIDWALKVPEQERPQNISEWMDILFPDEKSGTKTIPVTPVSKATESEKSSSLLLPVAALGIVGMLGVGGYFAYPHIQPLLEGTPSVSEAERIAQQKKIDDAKKQADRIAQQKKVDDAKKEADLIAKQKADDIDDAFIGGTGF